MKHSTVIALTVILTACASPQQMAELDDSRCRAYGFRVGTEDYAKCRMALDIARERENAAYRKNVGEAIKAYGDGYARAAQQQRTTTCDYTTTSPQTGTMTCR